MKRMNEEKLNKMAEFIHRYVRENNGESPKFKDILEYMEMSNSVGYRYLTTLRDRGIITYSGKDTLAIKGQEAMKTAFRRLAIVGSIVCGSPEDNRQEIQGYVAIPTEWIDGDCYLLRTSGDSMIDIGIDDGDLVLIRRCETVRQGRIVAFLYDNSETTLKRYKQDRSAIYLIPENDEMEPIVIKGNDRARLIIQGEAVMVMKDL